MLILYYSPGACSQAPHILLHETGIEHDARRVDLKAKALEDGGDYLAINPKGAVPALQLDSGAILNGVTWLSIGRGNGIGTATSNLTLNGSSSITSTHLSAGFNAGNSGNLPKGAITLNGTSSLPSAVPTASSTSVNPAARISP